MKDKGFSTRAIHSGHLKNEYGALNSPIYQTSTFVFDSCDQGGKRFAGEEEGYIYSRLGNPTVTEVENKIASLEGGEAGVAMSSGIGAITATIWTLIKSGDHIIADKVMYSCTHSFFKHGLKEKFGVEVDFVDTSDLKEIKSAIKPNTRIIYIESPTNPTMKLCDIEEISKISKSLEECYLIVDNTYCTPYIQKPLSLGADIVVHSATKYINGHGDVIAGLVVGTKELMDRVRYIGQSDMNGSVLGPFEAFLVNRGMKTLSIRMERHCDNAVKVSEFLEKNDKIINLAFPGSDSFAQRELAKKQMALPGAMICFELKGGFEAGVKFIEKLKLCKLAVSLGDAETLIQHPASMTHSKYSPEDRIKGGISDGLIRLSVGLEDVNDIIEDLNQALD